MMRATDFGSVTLVESPKRRGPAATAVEVGRRRRTGTRDAGLPERHGDWRRLATLEPGGEDCEVRV